MQAIFCPWALIGPLAWPASSAGPFLAGRKFIATMKKRKEKKRKEKKRKRKRKRNSEQEERERKSKEEERKEV